MPVTTTLLLKLRKALGDEAADELVTWVDQATARELGQIRDLAELHYGRFDARLEQRLAELKAELRLDQRLAELKAEFNQGIAELKADVHQRIAELKADVHQRIAELKAELRLEMAAQRAELIKWMFVFWVGTIVPLAGLMVALLKP